MSHPAQMQFCQRVRDAVPDFFVGREVVDCGSRNVNGDNRYLFTDCKYLGIDLTDGPGVDRVGHFADLAPTLGECDVCISTEALEHDERWQDTIKAMVDLLRPGGLLLITCAGPGRAEHGTLRSDPGSCPGCSSYYQNISCQMIRDALDLDALFTEDVVLLYNEVAYDTYLAAIKK